MDTGRGVTSSWEAISVVVGGWYLAFGIAITNYQAPNANRRFTVTRCRLRHPLARGTNRSLRQRAAAFGKAGHAQHRRSCSRDGVGHGRAALALASG